MATRNRSEAGSRRATCVVFLGALVCIVSGAADGQNLLANPSAEIGDLTGWTIIESGGSGWSAGEDPQSGRLAGGHDGCAMFFTDGEWCRRSQLIDLVAAGYTAGELDAAPDITASEWFHGFSTRFVPQYNDTAYLKVELRAADGTTVIDSYDSGEFTTSNAWEQKSHTFTAYGAGVRYIYWEDGGKGVESWSTLDGPVLDEAFLTVDIAPVGGPEVNVTPASIDFGAFPRTGSWSNPQVVTVENNGTTAMAVNFCICDGNVDDFAFQNVPANDPIPAGDSIDLEVIFKPFTVGPRAATLRVYSDDADEPTTELTLEGVGVPVCTAITRADASPTIETTVDFNVSFSEDVQGVDATDFVLVESGVSGSSITNVVDTDASPGNGVGKTWVVTVSIGTGQGTVGLNLEDDDTIVTLPAQGSYPLGGVGVGNGDFAGGEVYQYLGTGQAFYVDDSALGSGDGSTTSPFSTIAEAVSNTVAARGDFIVVRAGTYSEQVVLKEGVTLESSSGAHHTHITGGGANQNVVTAVHDCVIRGFTIRNGGTEASVYVPASASSTVTNCILSDSGKGLLAAAGASVTFDNNTVYFNTTYGLRGETGAAFASVFNNIFIDTGTAFSADAGGVAASGYNCFHANTANYNGPPPAGTDFAANPLFVSAATDNFHLKAASPCRNAGSPLAAYNDKDGTRNDVGSDGGPGGVQDTVNPVASFTATPTSGDAPLAVNFNAGASSDEWGIATYLWDFDNSNGIQVDASGATPQHTFTVADSYVVTLRVQDNSGLSSQTTKQVNANDPANQPPTASAGANPRAGAAPFQVQFMGVGSDPDLGGVTYLWDFANGDTSTTQSPLYTYPADTVLGSYEVVLTVTDDESASVQDSVYVTVTQEDPDASGEVNPAAETVVTVNDGASAINGARVTVPAGASADPIVVSLGAVPEGNSPEPPTGAVSEVIEVGPDGATFSQPLTLRIPLNTTVTATDLLNVAAYDEDAGYWSTAGLSNVTFVDGDPVDYVTAETDHLSFFVAFLPPSGEDIDRNGSVNAIDVQLVINGALGLALPPGISTDVDSNGSTNAIDVQLVINAALAR